MAKAKTGGKRRKVETRDPVFLKEVSFVKERDTKNTWRFTEQVESSGDQPIIGTLYIQKVAFDGMAVPESLTVTIAQGE